MAIPSPWATDPKSPETAENASNWPPERERDHAGAGGYSTDSDESTDEQSGEVLQFPGASREVAQRDQPGTLVRLSGAASVWASEARESLTASIDGSVWRARPPSLRDIHARAQRAEWAGDIPALRAAGQWFGWVSLVITAVGYALLWLARRPSRLLLTTVISAVIVVLVFVL